MITVRSKQQKLEAVLDNIEIVRRIEKRHNPTVVAKDVAEGRSETIKAGKVLSYLHQLDCIDTRWEGRSSTRYDPRSLDLQKLEQLAELFKPEMQEAVKAVRV
jgi:hypothetical protein